ncbi:CASP8 associated protein 2 [Mactra antiquata]
MDVSKLSNTSVDELYGDIDDMYINQSNDVTVTQSDTTITSSTLSKVLPSNLSLPSSRNVTTDSDTVSTRNGETDEISQDINDVDFDLYDETIDEEQQCKNDTYNELKDKVEFLVAKLTELETENNILHQKTSKTEQEYIEAKRNIACLLLTTKGEIRRKDREIADLR